MEPDTASWIRAWGWELFQDAVRLTSQQRRWPQDDAHAKAQSRKAAVRLTTKQRHWPHGRIMER